MELKGVFSAVATPMDSEQAIDLERLRSLVESTVEAGVHGLVPCGSTGEFAHLTNAERRAVVEVVIEQVAGRVPVVPHVGALTTVEAIELARHAESAGASGVMAVAPYYDPLTPGEAKDYFRSVADSVACPVIVYNLPLATGLNLTPDDLVDIARSADNVEYVKDTSGNYDQVARLLHDCGEDIKTFIGWDTMLLAAFVEGAAGSIIGATNFLASRLVAIYDAVQDSDLDGAGNVWNEVYPVLRVLLAGGYTAGVKGAFEILGAPIGPPRSPVASIDAARRANLSDALLGLRLAV